MFVYVKSEPSLWTVGHYTPDGRWIAESDHGSSEEAARRAALLNGGATAAPEMREAPEDIAVALQRRLETRGGGGGWICGLLTIAGRALERARG